MPTWPILTRQTAAEGIPNFAERAPNQALGTLAKGAAQVGAVYDELADRDAAVDGASKLADFHLKMQKRQQEMQQKVTTPEGFTTQATEDFDKEAQTLLDSTPSRRTQQFLDQRLVQARQAHLTDAMAWEANTRVELRITKANGALDKFANIANTSPGRFDQVMGDFNAFVSEAGLPLAAAEKMRAAGRQTIARSAVQGQIETRAGGILKELQGGKWDDYLDASTKAGLVNAAQAEVKRAAAEAKARAQQAAALGRMEAFQKAQADVASRIETGVPIKEGPSQEQMKASMSPKEWANYEHQAKLADKTFEAVGQFATQKLEDMLKTLDTLKPTPGTLSYKDDQTVFQYAQQKLTAIRNLRASDPVAAVQWAPTVVDARKQLAAAPPEKRAAATQVVIQTQLAAQESVGIARPRVLSNAEAKQRVVAIQDPNQKDSGQHMRNSMQALQAEYGKHWDRVYNELTAAGLPDEARGFKWFNGDPVTANKLAHSITNSALFKKSVNPTDLKTLGEAVDMELQDFKGATDTVSAAQASNVIRQIALADLAAGKDPTTAAASAAKALTGRYDIRGSMRIPYTRPGPSGQPIPVDTSAVKLATQNVLVALQPGDIVPYDRQSIQSNADAQEAFVDSVQTAGRWITLNGDVGLVLVDPNGLPVLRAKDRARVSMDWEQAESLGLQITPKPGQALSMKRRGGLSVEPINAVPTFGEK